MKKIVYAISFDMIDTNMSTKIEISKAEYEKQFDYLTKQIKATEADETPVEQLSSSTYETNATIETRHFFMCGCATTTLYKTECKEGYCFKPKKDR